MPTYAKDIEAEITFLRPEDGGRRLKAFSGYYRPQFFYDGHDHSWDAVFHCDGRPYVDPGETVVAYVGFLNPAHHLGKLYPGKRFVLREGQRIVAKGRVTQVIELEQSARQRRGARQIDG